MKKLFIILTFATASCHQVGAPLTSADIDAIKKNIESFAQAVNTKSSDLGNGYADDVISMPPHNTSKVGKEKTIEFHSAPEPKVSSFVVNSEEIEGTGDLAYSRGTFVYKAVLNDSLEINDNGKYFVVFKKQADGSWKVTREIWNSDNPM
jgi:ketosteroid isomerase-like protein